MSETDSEGPAGGGGETPHPAPAPTPPLWTGDELERVTEGRLTADVGAITGVSIDSRTVRPGEAFFAIRGARFDGHQFAVPAITAGAAVSVVARTKLSSLAPGRPFLMVDDPEAALGRAGVAARARADSLTAVAITGSVGKTGTKEALRRALEPSGATHASAASHNNHWGVPLTLARLPRTARYLVSEIGMNHAGEITPLTRMVRPDIAIVTAVDAVHAEFFDSVDDIARAKAEIFLGLSPGGHAVINADNRYEPILTEHAVRQEARITYFGEAERADVRLVEVREDAGGSDVRASLFGEEVAYRVGAPGRHLVQNSLAVLAALSLSGADVHAGIATLADAPLPKGRGERVRLSLPGGGEALLVDESYNANPASVRAALAVLGATPTRGEGRRIAVLGDMLELGADADDHHRSLAGEVEAAGVAVVHTVGPLMGELHAALPSMLRGNRAETAKEIASHLPDDLTPGDVVMVKGSNAMGMARIVDALKARLADGGGPGKA